MDIKKKELAAQAGANIACYAVTGVGLKAVTGVAIAAGPVGWLLLGGTFVLASIVENAFKDKKD